MGKFFDQNSPLMRFLSRMTDLLWLNVLVLICCIPIITAGAALTAMNYVCLKLVRGKEGYITTDFFRSFKRNFKQATLIWIVVLLISIILGFDYWYLLFSKVIETPTWLIVALGIATLFILTCVVMIFPVLSHFENTIRGTVKNAFLIGIFQLPKTVLMILLWAVPPVFWYLSPRLAPLSWFFWFSLPGYLGALLYHKTFLRFEPEEAVITGDMEWTVSVEGDEDVVQESGEVQESQDNT
ncbi:MAG: DUF624 domain-containing protein [Lachnospiraceae bacterium]|nr:DUF624 domain-containing protein [Lachnospiraceae bacterium]